MTKDQISAIRLILVGAMISDYGVRLIVDEIKFEFKEKINRVLNSVKNLETYLIQSRNLSGDDRECLKRTFTQNEITLMAEIINEINGLSEDDLEQTLQAIKDNIQEEELP